MTIKLIAIDLDGTLLRSDKLISDATIDALTQARRAGVEVVLASARPPRTVLPFYRQLALETAMINYNGAMVYHPPTRRVILHRPIPTRTALIATELARRIFPKVLVSGEILDKWCTDRFDEAYLEREEFLTETAKLFRPDLVAPVETWLTQAVTKLLFVGSPAPLSKVAEGITDQLARDLTIVQTEAHLLQVMHPLASKTLALRAVAIEMGIKQEEIMTIGDNTNDAGMLRWAGVGVAMANSTPRALAAADYLTEDNDADGVAKAVSRAVLENEPPGEKLQTPIAK